MAFDLETLDPDDPSISKMENSIQMALVDVFGNGTIEHRQFSISSLYGGNLVVSMSAEQAHYQSIRAYQEGIVEAVATLEGARDYLTERLEDLGEAPGGQAIRAFDTYDLHPVVGGASSKLFRDGHYAEAIFAACKALNNVVQSASGIFEGDGDDLMKRVFSAKNPILRFNDMDDKWDEGEQRGFMDLYAGAIGAFRNQRGHKFIQDDPEFALEVIAFVSFLAKLAERAEKVE